MNETQQHSGDESESRDLETWLQQFRPARATASLQETLYNAGWQAAMSRVARQSSPPVRKRWPDFVSGVFCGLAPVLLLALALQFAEREFVDPAVGDAAPQMANGIVAPVKRQLEKSAMLSEVTAGPPLQSVTDAMSAIIETLVPELTRSSRPESMFGSPEERLVLTVSASADMRRWHSMSDLSRFRLTSVPASSTADLPANAIEFDDTSRPSLSLRSSVMNDEVLRDLFL